MTTQTIDSTLLSNDNQKIIRQTQENPPREKKKDMVSVIFEDLSNKMFLFKDSLNRTFASIPHGDHSEIYSIRSSAFKDYLSWRVYKEFEKKSISSNAKNQLIDLFNSRAMECRQEDITDLNVRVARKEWCIQYDLSNDAGEYVHVSEDGWDIRKQLNPIFKRWQLSGRQVQPIKNGDAWKIFDFVNVTEDQKLLALIYMVSMLFSDISHPISIIHGPKGSAKSTFGKFLKMVIDPSKPYILAMPRNPDEIIMQFNQYYFIVYDNASSISDEVSDQFCRAVTWEGSTKRRLYTDDDSVVYEFKRGFCITGINMVTNRSDFLDRSILFEMDRIPEDKRRTDEEIGGLFQEALPGILGWMFDIASKALQILPTIQTKRLFRLADFTKTGIAIAIALGKTEKDFMNAYQNVVNEQNQIIIEEDQVASSIISFAQKNERVYGSWYRWTGAPSDLLPELLNVIDDASSSYGWAARYFPKTPASLSRKIRMVEDNLRSIWIDLRFLKDTGGIRGRYITIQKVKSSVMSDSSVTSDDRNQTLIQDSTDSEDIPF